MSKHTANAIWNGGLKDGKGNLTTGSGALDSAYSFKTRFEEDKNGTTPEELIGAAHAGCFSMFLSSLLEKDGHTANHIRTTATIQLDVTPNGPLLSKIELVTEGDVPGLAETDFQKYALEAKEKCPISAALKAVPEIKLTATLK
ncbi:MAG: peroxiredoxin [Cytophagales bacterium CG18_big_fil_WC_8_21_14_2_50_42_9]|nr:MAG: peroxiredoxin [Cytophagales bacterium CG18_big_fil_WC_8_21_14_2_50_42_9]